MRKIILISMMAYDVMMFLVMCLSLTGIGGTIMWGIFAAMIVIMLTVTVVGTETRFFERHGIYSRPWWRKVMEEN